MLRTSLLVLLVLASATVAARDVKHADANGACSSQDDGRAPQTDAPRPSAAKPARPRPSVHGDAPARMQSPRWHSFLPGMFR